MASLIDRYRADQRVATLAKAIRADQSCTIGAVHGSLAPLLIAAALDGLAPDERPWLVVSGQTEHLLDDFDELGLRAAELPALDELTEEHDEDAHELNRMALARRSAALEQAHKGAILVATPHAIDQAIPALTAIGRASITLRAGDSWEIGDLAEALVEQHYHVSQVVEAPGQLAVHGGILDVFPLSAEQPYRIEFFGDEVDTLRLFDPFSQESIRLVDEARLTTSGGLIADRRLWDELPPGPVLVLADLPLAPRLRRAHGRHEIRLARQLPGGAVDGASVGTDRFLGDLRRDLGELRQAAVDGEVCCLCRNQEAAAELQTHLDDTGIVAEVTIGRLSAGFRDLDANRVVVHDFELAHRRPNRRRKKRLPQGTPLASLTDLRHGDYVVHANHGIARFRGMATLEKRGYLEDYLLLEFAGEAKLYLPVTGIDLVQKYIGGSGRHPDLSKLGSKAWQRRRAKAEKAVEDLAAELLEVHAKRRAAGGIRHDPDSPAQRRFESSFPYEETEDQLTATREIKSDMERPVTMERLLCGDVGFGKTEVALRAAFKAVSAGFQVAVLAPTTLLAEQHAATFGERLAGQDIGIACLNRFRSRPERQAILEQTRDGDIGILIGTHALLSAQVRFANLGLLVVDEEHRFGVKHKEALKQVKAGIDVLSLSATPIPRTLHFSLSGLRDISLLAEAPADRLAVLTRVAPWDKQLLRGAIERELDRGGQVFFIHHRVKDIDTVANRLQRLVPEMRLAVIHGQMGERAIAEAMLGFKAGLIDCLVSTSIVESGIDIPNANTLFVNNAHHFGLSELHQFRGRIGRFTHQAYAYFLVPQDRPLSAIARERLGAIEDYSELGAGFKLAMRDLELRGAGNLLGAEQSGHIDAIGYELYCQLLADSVRRLGLAQGLAEADRPRVQATDGGATLAFPVDAYIPDDYIDNPALKFELHQSLESSGSIDQLHQLVRITRDRFGQLPEAVIRLVRLRAIRLTCRAHHISRVDVSDRQFRLHLDGSLSEDLAAVQLPELVHVQLDGQVVVLFTRLQDDSPDTRLTFLQKMLRIELPALEK